MRGKKLLSLVLSIAMMISTLGGLTMTSASAAVGDAANNVWTASSADAGKLAGDILADDDKGTLTTMFDLTYADSLTDSTTGETTPISETVGERTFSAYVSHPSMNGGWDNNAGTVRSDRTTLFKYVPKSNGVLTVYFMDVASGKNMCILKDGTTSFKTPGVDGGSIVYTPGPDESTSVSAQLEAGSTYYFFVDGSKGRFMAVDFEAGAVYEQATSAPSTPSPTLDPNAKIYEWAVSDADVSKKAGDLLMTGLSLVSDNAGTNKYVTALDNGDLVGGVISGSALQFVAPENGTLSVTFKDLGNVDSIKTAHIYDATAGKEVASYTTQGLAKETFDLSAGVAEGSTYYIYANGTRARYSAAKFTPGEAPKDYSWSVSESDIGKVADTALMEGLTLVADNSSESDKYITAAENGKITKSEEDGSVSVTGAALKFVAPENGKLEVTMIDVGSENEDGSIKVVNPVIYDYESGNDLFSYENTAAKETVVLSADVEAGKTYYILATGTKGRFSAAKFTPAGEVVPTEAPATETPATATPLAEAIAYADGTVTVTLADVESAVLINASYADGVLSSITTYDLTFADGVATQVLEAAEGSKLMVWDSLSGMKPLCASYTVAGSSTETDIPATVAPTPTQDTSGLPADVIFRADDAAFDSLFATIPTVETTANGLTVSAGFGVNNKKVSYTHNGVDYQFTRQWKHGNSAQTLTFTPATSCVVTVVFNGNGGVDRKVTISQGGSELAAGLSTEANTAAAEVVVADILDASAGDVVIGGGGSNKNISAIFVEYYDATPDKAVTGKITNSTGEDLSAETIVFTNTADATDVVEMAYTENYSVNLTKGVTYAISVKGKEDTICPTISTAEVTVTKNRNAITHDFELVKIGNVEVTGTVSTLSSHDLRTPVKAYDSAIGATLNFTKEGDSEATTATVNADGTYSVSLLSNENYTVALSGAEGYTLSTLSASYELPGGIENPTKNVLIMKDVADSVEYKDTITVGADKDYPTVSDAVAAIRKMARTTERVTIVVDPGTYTEQVYLDVNNVTLKSADAANPALISWYYGIGYEYYSAAKDGWYNADAAVAKTSKGTAQKWGGTVYVRGSGFLAENIKFQSSFNLEIVPQELADGVAPGGDSAKNFDRTAEGADPKSRAAVERAAAMLVEGANAEFYQCSFQSSQDTLWTGSSAAYFRECDIYGGTDYIFGGNSVVFDRCNLIWQGYSDQQIGGYITACKNSSTEDNGYLMLNCTVKNNTADSGQQFAQGGYGRNWGGESCKVIFLNTKLDGDAKVAGWTAMGGPLENSNLYVVNTIDKDGNPVTLTAADKPCGELSAEDIAAIDPYDYFNEWTPVHYEGEVPESKTIGVANFMNGAIVTSTETTAVDFGLTATGARVAVDSEDAVWTFTGFKYHSAEHGVNPGTITVDVPGPVKITYGTCGWGGDVTVKDASGATVATFSTNNGTCYHGNTTDNVVVAYYKGEATTLTLTGGKYLPYVKIEKVDLSEIPNTYTVTYAVGDSGATGVVPAKAEIEIGKAFTVPVNRTLYVEGKTLTGWTDGTNTYAVGSEVTTVSESVELTPVFTENPTVTQTEEYSVTFDFQRQNGAPVVGWQGTSGHVWVAQATIGDATIDVKMDIDTTSGKVANGSWQDWAQINKDTKLSIPVVANSVITFVAYDDTIKYKVGETEFTQKESYTVSEAGIVDLINVSGSYTRTITVTYPASLIPFPTVTPTAEPTETTQPTAEPTATPVPTVSETLNFVDCTFLSGNGSSPRKETANIGYTNVDSFQMMYVNPGVLTGYTGASIYVSGGAGKNCAGTVELYATSASTLEDFDVATSTKVLSSVVDNSSTDWGKEVATVAQLDLTKVTSEQTNLVFVVTRADGAEYAGGNFHKVIFTTEVANTVEISDTITGGSVSTDKATAIPNEIVTLTATPDSGNKLDSMTIEGVELTQVNATTYTFKMPATAVTVNATFAAGSSVTVTNPDVLRGGYISADVATIDDKTDVITLTAKLWDGITTVDWNVTYGDGSEYTVTDTVVTDDTATATINFSSVEDFTIGDAISVSAEFSAGADAKVLYFADVTPDESKHLEKNNGIVQLGYVKTGNLLKSWTVEGGNFYTLDNGKKLKTATFYATKGASNTATMSNGTTASANTVDMSTSTETVTVYDNTGAANTSYSKASCDVSDLTAVAGSENTIYWTNSGAADWCGNWLYIILNYDNAATE